MVLKWLVADDNQKPPSSRLHFTHVSFYIAAACVIFNAAQSWTAIAFFTICCVLYMFKEIDKFKFSAKDQTVEVEDTSEVTSEKQN